MMYGDDTAFPVYSSLPSGQGGKIKIEVESGLTKREFMATLILQGHLAGFSHGLGSHEVILLKSDQQRKMSNAEFLAGESVRLADALIAELRRKDGT